MTKTQIPPSHFTSIANVLDVHVNGIIPSQIKTWVISTGKKGRQISKYHLRMKGIWNDSLDLQTITNVGVTLYYVSQSV